ncbi:MAG: hypothetical protein M3Z17_05255 [Gemmatimonadota bacterium]|nr:hypothetical protein [Gemmatimonadota bacterium]
MTRQRKTQLFILALVPMVVFTAVRCADSSATTAPAPTTDGAAVQPEVAARLAKLHQQFDGVGKDHNDALAFVLKNLQRLPEKNRDRRNICETARRAFAEFHKNRFGGEVPSSIDRSFASFCQSPSPSAGVLSAAMLADNSALKDLSPAAEGYFDQIAAAVDASGSVDDLANQVSGIEAAAAANLSYDEAGDVVMVGSVAINSAYYWVQSLPAWAPYLLSTPDYMVRFSALPSAGSGVVPRSDWSSIWSDAKAAAKRAVGGDVKAAAKVAIGIGAATAAVTFPVAYDLILTGAAVGSIGAVLMI